MCVWPLRFLGRFRSVVCRHQQSRNGRAAAHDRHRQIRVVLSLSRHLCVFALSYSAAASYSFRLFCTLFFPSLSALRSHFHFHSISLDIFPSGRPFSHQSMKISVFVWRCWISNEVSARHFAPGGASDACSDRMNHETISPINRSIIRPAMLCPEHERGQHRF